MIWLDAGQMQQKYFIDNMNSSVKIILLLMYITTPVIKPKNQELFLIIEKHYIKMTSDIR